MKYNKNNTNSFIINMPNVKYLKVDVSLARYIHDKAVSILIIDKY